MNKKEKIFRTFMTILFIGFIGIYISNKNGYNEYEKHKRVELTNKEIQKFEEDIKNNKEVDIKDYLVNEEVDYTNRFTRLMYGISDNGNKLARKIIKGLFKKLSYLVED